MLYCTCMYSDACLLDFELSIENIVVFHKYSMLQMGMKKQAKGINSCSNTIIYEALSLSSTLVNI